MPFNIDFITIFVLFVWNVLVVLSATLLGCLVITKTCNQDSHEAYTRRIFYVIHFTRIMLDNKHVFDDHKMNEIHADNVRNEMQTDNERNKLTLLRVCEKRRFDEHISTGNWIRRKILCKYCTKINPPQPTAHRTHSYILILSTIYIYLNKDKKDIHSTLVRSLPCDAMLNLMACYPKIWFKCFYVINGNWKSCLKVNKDECKCIMLILAHTPSTQSIESIVMVQCQCGDVNVWILFVRSFRGPILFITFAQSTSTSKYISDKATSEREYWHFLSKIVLNVFCLI